MEAGRHSFLLLLDLFSFHHYHGCVSDPDHARLWARRLRGSMGAQFHWADCTWMGDGKHGDHSDTSILPLLPDLLDHPQPVELLYAARVDPPILPVGDSSSFTLRSSILG